MLFQKIIITYLKNIFDFFYNKLKIKTLKLYINYIKKKFNVKNLSNIFIFDF